MTGMRVRGADLRAHDARSAANRLRWEVDIALGVWGEDHQTPGAEREAVATMRELAETVAILLTTAKTIYDRAPEHLRHGILDGRTLDERFHESLAYYLSYHETAR